jgi:hypothetical protein
LSPWGRMLFEPVYAISLTTSFHLRLGRRGRSVITLGRGRSLLSGTTQGRSKKFIRSLADICISICQKADNFAAFGGSGNYGPSGLRSKPHRSRSLASPAILPRLALGLASLLLVYFCGLPQVVGRRPILRRGNCNVHHSACDRLPDPRCTGELCDHAGRELKSGSSLNGWLHGARRHGVGEGILGEPSTLS